MKPSPLRRSALAALALGAGALAGCATFDTQKAVAEKVETAKQGPQAAPFRSITNFSNGLRCMDNMLLDFGVHDVAVIVEDLADQTKKINAGTKDMLISAVSDMTRRSRAVRMVAYGQDSGNTIGFLFQALRREQYAVVPQYAVRGSVSQFDDNLVRRNVDAGLSFSNNLGLSAAATTQASVLGIDLTMLSTTDLSVLPGVASRNSVVLFKAGKGYDGEAQIKKFGINFSLSTGTQEGQTQAVRTLVELAAIELFGRLAKVPYWSCIGASDTDEAVLLEIRDWYDAVAANPTDIIAYFQYQLRQRRVYDGPVDGIVNPQIKEAVARYREALGQSREPKLTFEFFQAYLTANNREIAAKVAPVPAATVAGQAVPPTAAVPAPVSPGTPSTRLALEIGTVNRATRFAPGELIQLSIKPSRDAHVYCFIQDEKQRISRFFPNRFRPDSRVEAAQGVQLPGAMRFEIRMNPQGTKETISCLATDSDVLPHLPPSLGGSDFAPLPLATLEQVRELFVNLSSGILAQEYFHVESK
jgi:peptidoglycan hydrolase-like protein with peptidoglycan-binding domain